MGLSIFNIVLNIAFKGKIFFSIKRIFKYVGGKMTKKNYHQAYSISEGNKTSKPF